MATLSGSLELPFFQQLSPVAGLDASRRPGSAGAWGDGWRRYLRGQLSRSIYLAGRHPDGYWEASDTLVGFKRLTDEVQDRAMEFAAGQKVRIRANGVVGRVFLRHSDTYLVQWPGFPLVEKAYHAADLEPVDEERREPGGQYAAESEMVLARFSA